jgi:hypothetical protein
MKAKRQRLKAAPRKTVARIPAYVELDDGQQAVRFEKTVDHVLGLSAAQAAEVRRLAKLPVRRRSR